MKVIDRICRVAELCLVIGASVFAARGEFTVASYVVSLACYAHLVNNHKVRSP